MDLESTREGLWAPPGPQAIGAPELLVVGLGRRLRASEDGQRTRFGAGALEAIESDPKDI